MHQIAGVNCHIVPRGESISAGLVPDRDERLPANRANRRG